jgi:fluoroquinolone resistance protein
MKAKILKSRWNESAEALLMMNKVKFILKKGIVNNDELAVFGTTEDGLYDLRGLELGCENIENVILENVDLSFSNFSSTRIEKSVFKNVIFENVDFVNFKDFGNVFYNVSFFNCKFNIAAIGYDGSQYQNCIFRKSNFSRSVFIRAEFVGSQFENCKLNGVDFYGSSFENCSFKGKLTNVWFRGEYPYKSDEVNYGVAKKNQMSCISLKDAIIKGLTFSNNCNLENVMLPDSENYYYFDNWKKRLECLNEVIKKWDQMYRKEAEVFVYAYMVHAKNQDSYILSIEDIQHYYGFEVALKIIQELKNYDKIM